jgi:hypothetical protein
MEEITDTLCEDVYVFLWTFSAELYKYLWGRILFQVNS